MQDLTAVFADNKVAESASLQKRFEEIFGIKTSKLESDHGVGCFCLMRLVGLCNVYGITRSRDFDGKLNVDDREGLKKLVFAKTLKEAKDQYLKDAALYIQQKLNNNYVIRDFLTIAYPALHDGLSTKNKDFASRIANLTIVGELINAIPMVTTKPSDLRRKVKSVWDRLKSPEVPKTPLEQYKDILNKYRAPETSFSEKMTRQRDTFIQSVLSDTSSKRRMTLV